MQVRSMQVHLMAGSLNASSPDHRLGKPALRRTCIERTCIGRKIKVSFNSPDEELLQQQEHILSNKMEIP